MNKPLFPKVYGNDYFNSKAQKVKFTVIKGSKANTFGFEKTI